MMRFKKLTAGLMAAAILTVGMGSYTANAEPWATSHVNMPGAPYSESTVAYVTIYQKGAGARAVCNYNSHTNANATTGTTTIHCLTYTMTPQMITQTGSVECHPNVGEPISDISVRYQIYATTPTDSDIFWSKGNINRID